MDKIKLFCKSGLTKNICIILSLIVMLGLCLVTTKNLSAGSGEGYVEVVSADATIAEELQLYARSAVLMDAESGRVLYSKNADEVMAMASTTKIMTCIIALENGNLEDMVTASSYAASMPKVKLYLREGEQYKLRDLLYSLMLESHNDSAVAIAEHIGGSVEGFAEMMNQKAMELGCENSYFITPNGLDAVNNEIGEFHSTTATDLARIMAYCVNESPKREEFLKITQTPNYSFTNNAGRSYSCVNHNTLLTMMEGVISGKTGFTNKAGSCYVGAVKRDDRLFIVALLACGWPNNKSYKWADCRTLFNYGFDTYHYQDVGEKQEFKPVPVVGGIPKENDPYHTAYVDLKLGVADEPVRVLMKDTDMVVVNRQIADSLDAPVEAGQKVGSIIYTLNGDVIKEDPVVTNGKVEKQNQSWFTKYVFRRFLL